MCVDGKTRLNKVRLWIEGAQEEREGGCKNPFRFMFTMRFIVFNEGVNFSAGECGEQERPLGKLGGGKEGPVFTHPKARRRPVRGGAIIMSGVDYFTQITFFPPASSMLDLAARLAQVEPAEGMWFSGPLSASR